jgi:chromosome segregation ATPase
MRELQMERTNLINKIQECEELKMSLKFSEQKISNYQMKLDEKENTIDRLLDKMTQMEKQITRLEHEYHLCQKNMSKQQVEQTNSDVYTKSHHMNSQKPLSSSSNTSLATSVSSTVAYAKTNEKHIEQEGTPSFSANKSRPSLAYLNKNYDASIASYNEHKLSKDSDNNMDVYEYKASSAASLANSNSYNYQRSYNTNSNTIPSSDDYYTNASLTGSNGYPKPSLSTQLNDQSKSFDRSPLIDHLQHQQQQQQQQQSKLLSMTPEKQLKYIEMLESEFDTLMKQKQQLNAQLTRIPNKLGHSNVHTLRDTVENELNSVEKKLASVKLELRKLNIIKTH